MISVWRSFSTSFSLSRFSVSMVTLIRRPRPRSTKLAASSRSLMLCSPDSRTFSCGLLSSLTGKPSTAPAILRESEIPQKDGPTRSRKPEREIIRMCNLIELGGKTTAQRQLWVPGIDRVDAGPRDYENNSGADQAAPSGSKMREVRGARRRNGWRRRPPALRPEEGYL